MPLGFLALPLPFLSCTSFLRVSVEQKRHSPLAFHVLSAFLYRVLS